MANRWRSIGNSERLYFWGSKVTADGDCSDEMKRFLLLRSKALTNLDSIIKKQRHYFADKGLSTQSYGFSNSLVLMWQLDHKESWVLKKWCLWVVLEKAPEIPLDSKVIKSVSLKGKQPWIVIERTNTEAEAPVFWLSDANSWLIGKVPDAGKARGHKEKRASEDEMAGWHHRCNGHELRRTREMVRDRVAWRAAVHGVAKSRTWLGDNNNHSISTKWNII